MLQRDDVKKLATLARIELREDELDKFQQQLGTILTYVEELKAVNTDGLVEVSQVTGLENVMREDVAVVSANRDEILAEAPEVKDGFYKVKAIL